MDNLSAKKQAIFQATLDLLVAQDLQSVTMSLIAKKAGVGMGTIYNYFDSKETLIADLYRLSKRNLQQAIFVDYPKQDPIRKQFLHIWRTMCQHHLKYPTEFIFLERYAYVLFVNQTPVQDDIQLWGHLNNLFDEAKKQQIVKDWSLPFFLAMVTGPLRALLLSHITKQITLDATEIEVAITAIWDTIKY